MLIIEDPKSPQGDYHLFLIILLIQRGLNRERKVMQSAQCQNQVEIEQQNNQAINNAGVVQNPTSSGAQSLQKREKQRPETWNKIEQQIFFNALRQVSQIA